MRDSTLHSLLVEGRREIMIMIMTQNKDLSDFVFQALPAGINIWDDLRLKSSLLNYRATVSHVLQYSIVCSLSLCCASQQSLSAY